MLTNRIYEWARSHPKKPALIHNDITFSYHAFARAIETSRRFFKTHDLPAGQTAIVLIQSLSDAWIVVLGLRALGLNTISVKSMLQIYDLRINKAACIVIIEKAQQTALDIQAFEQWEATGTKIIKVPAEIYTNAPRDLPIPEENAPPFGGHILYTSGTTGRYKKIFMPGDIESKRNTIRAQAMSFDENTIHHGIEFSLGTGAGFKQPSALWQVGGCIVLDQRRGKFERFFKHNITSSAPLPPMLKELVETHAPDASGGPRYDCELGISSGFLPLDIAEKAKLRLTEKILIRFSATEMIRIPMLSRFRTVDDLYWLEPAPGCIVEVADENGNECALGQEGELRILLTDIDCSSYLDDEEATSRIFRDGYFYPGDMAVRRADGRIRILGRAVDVINMHGEKLAVAPLEQKLQQTLQVDEVCLFSRFTDDGKEEIVVTVQSTGDLPASAIDFLRGRFRLFDHIRVAVFTEFPRTDAGTRKTRRSELRVLAMAEETVPEMIALHMLRKD